MTMLGYIPFLDPLNILQDWSFLLLIPLSFGISMVYKAVRLVVLDGYWRHVTVMATQVIVAIVLLAIGLIILVTVVVPLLPIR